ncbi:uncharacterized protein LOC108319721 isoform X3 [Vigna angularis]|uniref:uncharacterized protein LOC108319721 isoform X3 n=1 Tax=Phaseolus angularis TaxID=3914 RepID=UPI0022B4ACCA|nr:uncharacterized protein LOC108319721 isoform X3 [Vigna angularis]
MSNFTKKKFVHILHRQSFFKGKLKMQGNYCISAGDSKLSVEMLVIDEIVPTLLHALEDDETSDTALDGLKQILRGYHNGMSGAYISYGNEDCIEESFGMEFQWKGVLFTCARLWKTMGSSVVSFCLCEAVERVMMFRSCVLARC